MYTQIFIFTIYLIQLSGIKGMEENTTALKITTTELVKSENNIECEHGMKLETDATLLGKEKVSDVNDCISRCDRNLHCKSVWYNWSFDQCYMYSDTRYERPADYVSSDSSDVYCTVHAPVLCSAGSERIEGRYCKECREGTYKPEEGNTRCQTCQDGLGPVGVVDSWGKWRGTGSTKCSVICTSGEEYRNGENCTACDVDMYKEGHNAGPCINCKAGMGTGGSIGASMCYKACPAGKQHSTQGCKSWEDACCTDCREDTYKATESSALCIPCDTGSNTKGETGSRSCTRICNTGQYSDGGDNNCTDCPVNTYKQRRSSLHCQACEDGYGTGGKMGYQKCFKKCLPGQHSMYLDTCMDCLVDTYKPTGGSEFCKACSYGYTTNGHVGATRCTILMCPAGLHISKNGRQCIQCPVNTFQAIASSGQCKPCQSGFYTEEKKGATTCVNIVDTVGNRVGVICGIAASILTVLAMSVTLIKWGKKKLKKRRQKKELAKNQDIEMTNNVEDITSEEENGPSRNQETSFDLSNNKQKREWRSQGSENHYDIEDRSFDADMIVTNFDSSSKSQEVDDICEGSKIISSPMTKDKHTPSTEDHDTKYRDEICEARENITKSGTTASSCLDTDVTSLGVMVHHPRPPELETTSKTCIKPKSN